ncbi:hypothetical protein [Ideonella sp. YS5]|uniref:hypothetical protein n=1 Tax=Ideonella sp. YS5 TaxID=3453714 RepID=UPI003EEF6382
MSVPVDFNELFAAYEWVSGGEGLGMDCRAYISRSTGTVHWCGEGVDEELPEDIEDGTLYIAVPHKNEFDLGRSLAFRFVEEHLPRSREAVHKFFRKRGAYAKFKSLLASAGVLDAWHVYEGKAVESALREWCEENGFVLVR